MKPFFKVSLIVVLFFVVNVLQAQDAAINGKILDKESQESVPFATVIRNKI